MWKYTVQPDRPQTIYCFSKVTVVGRMRFNVTYIYPYICMCVCVYVWVCLYIYIYIYCLSCKIRRIASDKRKTKQKSVQIYYKSFQFVWNVYVSGTSETTKRDLRMSVLEDNPIHFPNFSRYLLNHCERKRTALPNNTLAVQISLWRIKTRTSEN